MRREVRSASDSPKLACPARVRRRAPARGRGARTECCCRARASSASRTPGRPHSRTTRSAGPSSRSGGRRSAERELERAELLRRAPEPRLDHAHSLLALAAVRIVRGRLTLAAAELDAAREQLDAFADVGTPRPRSPPRCERALDEARSGVEKRSSRPTLPSSPSCVCSPPNSLSARSPTSSSSR